jgi:uncharacterized Zn finger protein
MPETDVPLWKVSPFDILYLWCRACSHEGEVRAEPLKQKYGPEFTLRMVGRIARCKSCGKKGNVKVQIRSLRYPEASRP